MAPMIAEHPHKTLFTIASLTIVIPALIISSLFFLLYKGMPLHDLRLWILEINFRAADSYHPPESTLLQKKTYLGGPSTHGSGVCDFFVGELRSSPLPKEKIWQAYSGGSIRSFNGLKYIPLQILFFDEERWTMDSPLGDWWDEWYYGNLPAAIAQTAYFVFASQKGYHYLGDLRCDD
ncbi:MAG: hypothetical protein WAP52_01490 [Candidatus Sungiibacteriota bacterium]